MGAPCQNCGARTKWFAYGVRRGGGASGPIGMFRFSTSTELIARRANLFSHSPCKVMGAGHIAKNTLLHKLHKRGVKNAGTKHRAEQTRLCPCSSTYFYVMTS